jgi:hypothetical protein
MYATCCSGFLPAAALLSLLPLAECPFAVHNLKVALCCTATCIHIHSCDCLQCCSVSQAITKAVQISVARTLQQQPAKFAVSAQAFYYCAPPAGRSCKTGCVLLLVKSGTLVSANCI